VVEGDVRGRRGDPAKAVVGGVCLFLMRFNTSGVGFLFGLVPGVASHPGPGLLDPSGAGKGERSHWSTAIPVVAVPSHP